MLLVLFLHQLAFSLVLRAFGSLLAPISILSGACAQARMYYTHTHVHIIYAIFDRPENEDSHMYIYIYIFIYKSSKMAHFVLKCNKEDYLSLSLSLSLSIYIYIYIYIHVCILCVGESHI